MFDFRVFDITGYFIRILTTCIANYYRPVIIIHIPDQTIELTEILMIMNQVLWVNV